MTWNTPLLACIGLVFGCDPGSTISITPAGDRCNVSLRANDTDFAIEMTLGCAEGAVDCYEITSLTCQGIAKTEVPIDLSAGGCPGADYCIADCAVGLDAPGTLWDIPEVLAVTGCNTYTDGST